MSPQQRAAEALEIGVPRTPAELEEYYGLRWRVLREPLGLAPGSERDELEAAALHVTARDRSGRLVGVGRVHFNSAAEAQIRYMATDLEARGQGVGRAVIARLEALAAQHGRTRIVLNARLAAVGFYERAGYRVVGIGPTLAGHVLHRRMAKTLDPAAAG